MRFRGLSRTFVRMCLGIFVLSAMAATANGGRDFAGVYGFTGVQEHGDSVSLTLNLRLFNNSEADIRGAIVTLMEGPTGVGLRGSFPTVTVWRKGQDVKLSGQFTVPTREYKDWLQPPAQPNVVIIYQDASGKLWEKGAQMRPQPKI